MTRPSKRTLRMAALNERKRMKLNARDCNSAQVTESQDANEAVIDAEDIPVSLPEDDEDDDIVTLGDVKEDTEEETSALEKLVSNRFINWDEVRIPYSRGSEPSERHQQRIRAAKRDLDASAKKHSQPISNFFQTVRNEQPVAIPENAVTSAGGIVPNVNEDIADLEEKIRCGGKNMTRNTHLRHQAVLALLRQDRSRGAENRKTMA